MVVLKIRFWQDVKRYIYTQKLNTIIAIRTRIHYVSRSWNKKLELASRKNFQNVLKDPMENPGDFSLAEFDF